MNTQRVYSPLQAAIGSLLGAPLSSIVFIRHNFKVLGNANAEKKTTIYGAIIYLLLLGASPFFPDDIPWGAIVLASVFIPPLIVIKLQFTYRAIAASPHLDFQSGWRVFGVSLACFFLTLGASMALWRILEYFGVVRSLN